MRRPKLQDIWLALVVAIVLALPALISDKSALRLLIFGSPDYDGFKSPGWAIWLVPIALVISIIALALTQIGFSTITSRHASFVSAERQKEAQAVEDERVRKLQERIDAGVAAGEARIRRLISEGYSDPRIVRSDESMRITEAERQVEIGALSNREIRIEVDDQYGVEKLYLVFHIFENTAFWRYDSRQTFESSSAKELVLASELESSPIRATLATYDSLIGVGLMSNSVALPVAVADDRARLLCSMLTPYGSPKTEVFGLSIGNFVGEPKDTARSPRREQRPVVIVGVIKRGSSASDTQLIEEIVRSVEFSGIDLLKYEYLRPGRSPRWYQIERCNARF